MACKEELECDFYVGNLMLGLWMEMTLVRKRITIGFFTFHWLWQLWGVREERIMFYV